MQNRRHHRRQAGRLPRLHRRILPVDTAAPAPCPETTSGSPRPAAACPAPAAPPAAPAGQNSPQTACQIHTPDRAQSLPPQSPPRMPAPGSPATRPAPSPAAHRRPVAAAFATPPAVRAYASAPPRSPASAHAAAMSASHRNPLTSFTISAPASPPPAPSPPCRCPPKRSPPAAPPESPPAPAAAAPVPHPHSPPAHHRASPSTRPRSRPRTLRTQIQHVRTLVQQADSMRHRRLWIEKPAAIAERVRRDVHHPHHQRPPPQFQRPRAQLPCREISLLLHSPSCLFSRGHQTSMQSPLDGTPDLLSPATLPP